MHFQPKLKCYHQVTCAYKPPGLRKLYSIEAKYIDVQVKMDVLISQFPPMVISKDNDIRAGTEVVMYSFIVSKFPPNHQFKNRMIFKPGRKSLCSFVHGIKKFPPNLDFKITSKENDFQAGTDVTSNFTVALPALLAHVVI